MQYTYVGPGLSKTKVGKNSSSSSRRRRRRGRRKREVGGGSRLKWA